MANNEWKEIEPVNQIKDEPWKPENEGDTLQGIYKDKVENLGENDSTKYVIETESGEVRGVWGSSVIVSQFEQIQIGMEVKLTFLGKEKGKKGYWYKNFKIETREVEPKAVPANGKTEEEEEKPIDLDSIPF